MNKNKKLYAIGASMLVLGMMIGYILPASHNNGPDMRNHMGMKGVNHDMSNMGRGMDTQMDGMLQGISGKTGTEFDKLFLSEMIIHHKGAVDMSQMVLSNSQNPELKKFAQKIIDDQTKEIAQMQNFQKIWFSSTSTSEMTQ